jgi:hypothetical protein
VIPGSSEIWKASVAKRAARPGAIFPFNLQDRRGCLLLGPELQLELPERRVYAFHQRLCPYQLCRRTSLIGFDISRDLPFVLNRYRLPGDGMDDGVCCSRIDLPLVPPYGLVLQLKAKSSGETCASPGLRIVIVQKECSFSILGSMG